MRQRIFIAINLPEEIKNQLLDYQQKWPELPIRWVKKDNLHITLIFLGYILDKELLEVIKATKEVVQKRAPFLITLNKICYGPPQKIPPRMIWVKGEKSENLIKLKDDLEKSLLEKVNFSFLENREFSPHITLGRIQRWEWRRIEPEERPEVEEDISLSFEVKSVEVMESKLKPKGAEYSVLESVVLGGLK